MVSKTFEVEPDGSDFLANIQKAMGTRQAHTCSFDRLLFDTLPKHIFEPLPNRAYRAGDYHFEFKGINPQQDGYVLFHVTIRKPKQLRLF